MINVLMPMAGSGSRFKSSTNTQAKPYVHINNKPMFVNALNGLDSQFNIIFIVNSMHLEQEQPVTLINNYIPNNKIYIQDQPPVGPVHSTLLAKESIDNENGLLMLDCDQITDWSMPDLTDIDGFVVVSNSDKDNYSYVTLDDNNYIVDIKEKEVISNHAVCGIYFWSKGSDYVKYSEDLILNKTIKEHYASHVIKNALVDGLRFKAVFADSFVPFNTLRDLEEYIDGAV